MTQDAKAVRGKFNKDSYYQAQGYAYALHKKDYVDVVHDAYLRWYDKTKQDLFDEPPGTIARVIKYTLMSLWQKNTWMYRGQTELKAYMEFNEDLYSPNGSATPLDQLIGKEALEQATKQLNPEELVVFDKMMMGYNQLDISKELGHMPQRVNYRVQQIRKKITSNTQ